jgi:hypothetical protein
MIEECSKIRVDKYLRQDILLDRFKTRVPAVLSLLKTGYKQLQANKAKNLCTIASAYLI